MKNALLTPVILIIFNRPDKVKKIAEVIRSVNPKEVFIIADGPRGDFEKDKVVRSRQIAEKSMGKDCLLHKIYAQTNMGAQNRIVTGLNAVFSQRKEAIILEDDCFPSVDFFFFCQELLERYRDDKRIMHIAGTNFQKGNINFDCDKSYYFSKITHNWGWATWERAWSLYDFSMKRWPEIQKKAILKQNLAEAVYQYWNTQFQKTFEKKNDAYDYRWLLTCWLENGLSIVPKVNLVSNIGSGSDALHPTSEKDPRFYIPIEKLDFPLKNPDHFIPDKIADEYEWGTHFHIDKKNLLTKLINKIYGRFC